MKRCALALVVLLGCMSPAFAQAPTFVQSAKHSAASGVNNDTPMGSNITNGNTIVYCISGGGSFNTAALTPANVPTLTSGTATIGSFTQRAGYLGVNNGATASVADAACWTAPVTGTGSATFRDTTGVDQYHTAVVLEFSGVTGVEGATSGFNNDAAPTLTVTNTTANAVIVVFQIDEGDRTNTSPGGSWASREKTVAPTSAPIFDIVTQSVSSAAGYTATWTLTGGIDVWATIGFALAGSGGGASTCRRELTTMGVGCEAQ